MIVKTFVEYIVPSRERNGSTILKCRQGCVDGMKVKSVPYWEWDKLRNDTEKKKQQYLRALSGV